MTTFLKRSSLPLGVSAVKEKLVNKSTNEKATRQKVAFSFKGE
jgi:hypothetical protein